MYKPKINFLCSEVVKYFVKEDRITIDKYLKHTNYNNWYFNHDISHQAGEYLII